MDASACLKRLIYVLSERDIGLGHDDLDWLFESPDTRDDMVAWVNEYLTERTLLSREEIELYSSLSEHASFKTALAQDEPSARPLDQLDFENSIRTLKDSTAAIDQQCSTLEAQIEAMKEIQRHNNQFSLEPHLEVRRQARQQGLNQSETETERLASSLTTRLANSKRETNGALASSKTAAQRQLDKDDRLLTNLQKIMSSVEYPDSQEKQTTEVAQLSQALVSLQGTVVKNRANQVYISTLHGSSDGPHGADEDLPGDPAVLASELDSLIEEVDTVLDMVVEHQYRQPILGHIRRGESEAQKQRQAWLLYVQTELQQMTQRLQDILLATQDLDAYSHALTDISVTLEKMSVLQQGTTARRPAPQNRVSHKAIQQLVLPATTGANPALDLLRHHGIRVVVPSPREEGIKSTVEKAISERQNRLAGLSLSTEQGITSHISCSVETADAQLQGLIDAVYAHSPYATINLANADCDARLQQLDKDVDVLAGELRQIELEALVQRERSHLNDLLASGMREHR